MTQDRAAFTAWFLEQHPERGDRLEPILSFVNLLLEASGRMSLVSRGDRDHLLARHVRECLAPELVRLVESGERLLDVGTGGGLPGAVLACLLPEMPMTWLEPRQRRAAFLERVLLRLGLGRVTVRSETLEEHARARPGAYDRITARALRWTPELVQALRSVSSAGAVMARFGGESGVAASHAIGRDRFLQVWPPALWDDLPDAP